MPDGQVAYYLVLVPRTRRNDSSTFACDTPDPSLPCGTSGGGRGACVPLDLKPNDDGQVNPMRRSAHMPTRELCQRALQTVLGAARDAQTEPLTKCVHPQPHQGRIVGCYVGFFTVPTWPRLAPACTDRLVSVATRSAAHPSTSCPSRQGFPCPVIATWSQFP